MRTTLFTAVLFYGSVFCLSDPPKITYMYALGDSVSDTGSYYKLSGGLGPDRRLYPKNRFTDDRTWVEYLSDKLSVKEFKSYAVGRATTDSKTAQVLISKDKEVPGCIQQAESLRQYLEGKNVVKKESLVTLAFFGNDFLGDTKPTPQEYVKRIKQCLIDVINTNKVGHIILPTRSGSGYVSYFDKHPELKGPIMYIEGEVEKIWDNELGALQSKYPGTLIHEFDYKKIIVNLLKQNPNQNKPCIDITPFENNDKFKVCKNPTSFIFYDQLHPTSTTHKMMADEAHLILTSSSSSDTTKSVMKDAAITPKSPEKIRDSTNGTLVYSSTGTDEEQDSSATTTYPATTIPNRQNSTTTTAPANSSNKYDDGQSPVMVSPSAIDN